MSQSHFRVIVAVCLFVFCLSTSSQAEIMYKSAKRTIYGAGTQLDAEEQSTTGLSPLTTDMLNAAYVRDDNNSIVGHVNASVAQNSTLSDNQIRGWARGSGFGSGGGEGTGRSTMFVEFDIDQSMRFTLTGQLRIAPHGDSIGLNGSNALIRLTGPTGVAMEVKMDQDNLPDILGVVDFTHSDRISDVFAAGAYTLEAFTEGHGSDGKTRCVDFDFTMTAINAVAVPEPSAAVMFLFAMVGIVVKRQHRN